MVCGSWVVSEAPKARQQSVAGSESGGPRRASVVAFFFQPGYPSGHLKKTRNWQKLAAKIVNLVGSPKSLTSLSPGCLRCSFCCCMKECFWEIGKWTSEVSQNRCCVEQQMILSRNIKHLYSTKRRDMGRYQTDKRRTSSSMTSAGGRKVCQLLSREHFPPKSLKLFVAKSSRQNCHLKYAVAVEIWIFP
jgi:hypothetical protein